LLGALNDGTFRWRYTKQEKTVRIFIDDTDFQFMRGLSMTNRNRCCCLVLKGTKGTVKATVKGTVSR